MPRFLISRLSALGDTVCSLPAASALKKAFPDAHVTWVVDPRFAGIVECCSAVDEVIRFKPSFKTLPTFEGEFDAALDLQGLLKSAVCVGRAKSAKKVGFHWQREGSWLFSRAVRPDPTSYHIVDQYVDVARAVGGIADRADFALKPKEEDVLAVRKKLKERGVVGRIVVLNAGAGWATKRWPPEHFATVVGKLQSLGLTPVLVGGRAEADQSAASDVISRCPVPPVNLLGETSVRELVALLRLATLHIGGDTGSSHLAAALDTPAIGLYSITRPQRSCPYGQMQFCHYDADHLSNIRPEAVLESVTQILA